MKIIDQIISLDIALWDVSRMRKAAEGEVNAAELNALYDRIDDIRIACVADLSPVELVELERARKEMRN